jgi:hypothetical protein
MDEDLNSQKSNQHFNQHQETFSQSKLKIQDLHMPGAKCITC